MRSRHAVASLALAALLVYAGAAAAGSGGKKKCKVRKRGGPVSLLIVDSSHKVHAFAATVKDASIVVQDATTIIFDDGRVVTSDAERASDHLNELGWGRRKIQLVVNFPARPARARRASPG